MDIRELTTATERREAVPLLRQLWTEKPPETVLAWTNEERYHLFGGYLDEELIAVAGVLLEHLLHHTPHAWLYDLVVDEPRRGNGHGTAMVEYVERWAAERDCESVALASPLGKESTHRFYEEQAYSKWGYIIQKEL